MGALGYVTGTLEIVTQLWEQGEAPTRLYFASGSRGTQAGLTLGARMYSASYRLFGIAVSGGEPEKTARALRTANEAAEIIGAPVHISPDDLQTDQEYLGMAYGVPRAGCLEAIRLLAQTEGIFLDPVYTGRAMVGLIDHIRTGRIDPTETVVFLHSGGTPALRAHTEDFLK